jgi:hypothetical protein
MISEYFALFHFEFKDLIFNFIQKNMKHTMVTIFEVHATNEQGEEFLCDEDNYNDAFFAGKHIFILMRTKELEDARKLCIQEQQTKMPSGKMETTQ